MDPSLIGATPPKPAAKTPGYKSSEFISAWASSIMAGGWGATDESPVVRAASILAVGLVFGAYALSRGRVKGVSQ